MNRKYLICFILIYFVDHPQFVVSHPTAMAENKFDRKANAKMSGRMKPVKTAQSPTDVLEGSNNLVADSDFHFYKEDTVCLDNFDIKPPSGSQTMAEMPAFEFNLVAIGCSWPITIVGNTAVEVTIQIQHREWDLSCTDWNLTLDYVRDLENPHHHMTLVCPRERSRILTIPPDAKRAALVLSGVVAWNPRFTVHWKYLNLPKLPEIDCVRYWSPLMILGAFFIVMIIGACCDGRRVSTQDEQIQTEEAEFQRTIAPRRPRPTTLAIRGIVHEQKQEQIVLRPFPPTFSTFKLQPAQREYLF